jgi:CDP-glycerol glycerophosphotransferase
MENNPELNIYWVFRGANPPADVDSRIRCLKFHSWEYLIVANTAEFLITNCRTDAYRYYWKKRPQQKYMMLWHGGVALKKIEKDAESQLGFTYLTKAKSDSKMCNLMISGCKAQTRLLQEKFWYDGEILESGIPRNDMLFATENHRAIREKVCSIYGITPESKLVLYAPTFRRNRSLDPYRIQWSEVITQLRAMYGTEEVKVFLRLHPNMLTVDTSPLLNDPSVIDVTRYNDMQELLSICDLLITDYSSSMFDFSMLRKPCIIYATDIEQYDRGYYYTFDQMPYPVARNQAELIETIRNFDLDQHLIKVDDFMSNTVGMFEDGNASRRIAAWMSEHSI